jgi:hypothetical protein
MIEEQENTVVPTEPEATVRSGYLHIDTGEPTPEGVLTITEGSELIEAEAVNLQAQEDEPQVDVLDAASTKSFQALAMAGSIENPAVTRKFKGLESFMAPNGVMMEREVFDIIPSSALTLPNPEAYSLGLTYGQAKPKGKLFSGQNRKARRAAEKQQLKKAKKKSATK